MRNLTESALLRAWRKHGGLKLGVEHPTNGGYDRVRYLRKNGRIKFRYARQRCHVWSCFTYVKHDYSKSKPRNVKRMFDFDERVGLKIVKVSTSKGKVLWEKKS